MVWGTEIRKRTEKGLAEAADIIPGSRAHHSSNGIWRGKHHNSIQSRGIGWIFISVGIGAGGCIYDNFYKDSG